MKGLALLVLVATAVPARAAEAPAASVVAQDPLMRQIRKRMMQPDGGVTTVTWVQGPNGQRMAITLVDPVAGGAALNGAAANGEGNDAALGGLQADRRLQAERVPAAGPLHGQGRVRTPTKQLKRLDEQKRWQP